MTGDAKPGLNLLTGRPARLPRRCAALAEGLRDAETVMASTLTAALDCEVSVACQGVARVVGGSGGEEDIRGQVEIGGRPLSFAAAPEAGEALAGTVFSAKIEGDLARQVALDVLSGAASAAGARLPLADHASDGPRVSAAYVARWQNDAEAQSVRFALSCAADPGPTLEAVGAIGAVSIPLDSVIGRLNLAIGELGRLAPGMRLALHGANVDRIELVAGGGRQVLGLGEMGKADGKRAIRLTAAAKAA